MSVLCVNIVFAGSGTHDPEGDDLALDLVETACYNVGQHVLFYVGIKQDMLPG